MSKVWLITATASGLGRNSAEAVLASGDRLVATACDPGRLEDLVKKYGDQVRTAPLDVADQAAAYVAVKCWRWRKDRKKTRPAGRHFCGI